MRHFSICVRTKVLEDCKGVWAVGNGATVWDAGLLLADFLGMQDSLEGATALELGAGLGLVGMCLSKFGARVVLTDRPLALPLLRRNVAENCLDWGLAAVAVESLVFGETLPDWAEGGFDVVVASDVVFPANSECHGALIETLRAVVQPKTRCWLAYEPRAEATNTAFFNSLGQFFDVQRVPAPDLPENAPDDLWIFRPGQSTIWVFSQVVHIDRLFLHLGSVSVMWNVSCMSCVSVLPCRLVSQVPVDGGL